MARLCWAATDASRDLSGRKLRDEQTAGTPVDFAQEIPAGVHTDTEVEP